MYGFIILEGGKKKQSNSSQNHGHHTNYFPFCKRGWEGNWSALKWTLLVHLATARHGNGEIKAFYTLKTQTTYKDSSKDLKISHA